MTLFPVAGLYLLPSWLPPPHLRLLTFHSLHNREFLWKVLLETNGQQALPPTGHTKYQDCFRDSSQHLPSSWSSCKLQSKQVPSTPPGHSSIDKTQCGLDMRRAVAEVLEPADAFPKAVRHHHPLAAPSVNFPDPHPKVIAETNNPCTLGTCMS